MAPHKAFNEFQIAADIKPTGGLHRGEETEKALIAALPQELQRLTGVKDHAIAFAEGAGNTTSVSFSRIPKAMLAAIEPVAKAIEDTLGLPLVPREPPRNRAGRIDLRIGVGYGVFLDSRGRPMADDKAPDAIRAAVAKVLKSDPRLDLDPNAAPGRMVISMLADSASVRELNQDFADLHIDFNVRDTMLAVVELDEALDEELGFGLPTAAGAGETALKYAEKLGFDSVHSAKLIDSGGTKALLAEVPRRASVSKKILDFLSQPPKIIAVKVAEAVGKTAKGSALEVIVIGGLEIMKVVTETTEWEESVGNFVSGAAKAVVATVLAAMTVAAVGFFFPAVALGTGATILVVGVVGFVFGQGLDIADDGLLAKYVTAGIRFLQDQNIELRGTPRDIYQIDDQQFWDMMADAKMNG